MGTKKYWKMSAYFLLLLPMILSSKAYSDDYQGSQLFDGGGANDLIKPPTYTPSTPSRPSTPTVKQPKVQAPRQSPVQSAPASRPVLSPANNMAIGLFGALLQGAFAPPQVDYQEQLRLQQLEEAKRAEAERLRQQREAEKKAREDRERRQAKSFLDNLNNDPSIVKIDNEHAVVRSLKGYDPKGPGRLQKVRVPLPGEENTFAPSPAREEASPRHEPRPEPVSASPNPQPPNNPALPPHLRGNKLMPLKPSRYTPVYQVPEDVNFKGTYGQAK